MTRSSLALLVVTEALRVLAVASALACFAGCGRTPIDLRYAENAGQSGSAGQSGAAGQESAYSGAIRAPIPEGSGR